MGEHRGRKDASGWVMSESGGRQSGRWRTSFCKLPARGRESSTLSASMDGKALDERPASGVGSGGRTRIVCKEESRGEVMSAE